MKFNYRQEVLTLPGAVLSALPEASAEAVRVLLWLSSDPTLADKPRQLSALSGCGAAETRNALRFWQECGILSSASDAEPEAVPAMATVTALPAKSGTEPAKKVPAPEPRPRLRRSDELPNYSLTELSALMEKRAEMRTLVDEAQNILGKMFNPSEVNILVGLVDYLGMNEECILLILEYCKQIGKTNLRAIEKYAFSLEDKGITDVAAVEVEIRRAEAMVSFEGRVRTLFGMGARALTAKEKKMLFAWLSYGYGEEIVGMAYEITVNATGGASVAYTNSILERWHTEGLKTAEEIRRALEDEAAQKTPKKKSAGKEPEGDELLEAALRRSFKERRDD